MNMKLQRTGMVFDLCSKLLHMADSLSKEVRKSQKILVNRYEDGDSNKAPPKRMSSAMLSQTRLLLFWSLSLDVSQWVMNTVPSSKCGRHAIKFGHSNPKQLAFINKIWTHSWNETYKWNVNQTFSTSNIESLV
jgi:hypothetical protein